MDNEFGCEDMDSTIRFWAFWAFGGFGGLGKIKMEA